MDRASARSSSLQLLSYCGLQFELKLFGVKMRPNGHYMRPSCHFSALEDGHVLATLSAIVLFFGLNAAWLNEGSSSRAVALLLAKTK